MSSGSASKSSGETIDDPQQLDRLEVHYGRLTIRLATLRTELAVDVIKEVLGRPHGAAPGQGRCVGSGFFNSPEDPSPGRGESSGGASSKFRTTLASKSVFLTSAGAIAASSAAVHTLRAMPEAYPSALTPSRRHPAARRP